MNNINEVNPEINMNESEKTDLQPELSEKEAELTAPEKKKLAILELGSDYKATVNIGKKFIFEIHAPTVEEDLKINIQSGNMLSSQIKNDNDLKFVTNIISTLDIVVDSIHKLKKDKKTGLTKREEIGIGAGCFWTWIKSRRDSEILLEVIIVPLYMEYIKFKDSLSTDLDELKNFYAQD